MKRFLTLLPVFVLTLGLTGCELIADIFKAGVWVGVLIVVVVIGLIIWLISKIVS